MEDRILPRMEDPRSFAIPCIVGKTCIVESIYNSGMHINLMSHTLYEELELSELKDTIMILQLKNRSV